MSYHVIAVGPFAAHGEVNSALIGAGHDEFTQ